MLECENSVMRVKKFLLNKFTANMSKSFFIKISADVLWHPWRGRKNNEANDEKSDGEKNSLWSAGVPTQNAPLSPSDE